MLVVDPDRDDEALERGLIETAEAYLRERGASVIYAGGQAPVNPFYWGIYGGSECAGILSSHVAFHARRSGRASSRWRTRCCSRPTSRSPSRATRRA